MPGKLRNALLIAIGAWSLALLPAQALAETWQPLECMDNGNPKPGTQLYFTGANNDQGTCQLTGIKHIFSQVVCNVYVVLNKALGSVYCGMQWSLQSALAALITLYVAVFGIQMLMGTTRLNPKETVMLLFKIAFVWLFVTESAWAIGYLFMFFLTLTGDGVYWVMQPVASTLANIMSATNPDGSANACFDPLSVGAIGISASFTYMDYLVCTAVTGPLTAADYKVIGFFTAMAFVFPPIFALAVYWLWMNFSIMVRGLITFLLGMSALAFLIALSPIFLSFMLFKTTFQFFENWLKYMISFSLQIIVIFACISMWITVTLYFVNFFNEIAATIFPFNERVQASALEGAADNYGICPYKYEPDVGGYGPLVTCKNSNFKPATNPEDRDKLVPLSAILMSKNPLNGEPINNTSYLYYIIYHLITLIVVCYAFDALVRDAPEIATQLAGPKYVPMLGDGLGFNRYGQIMTRASQFASSGGGMDKVLSRGGQPPEFLRTVTEKITGAASGGLVKNLRERIAGSVAKPR